MIGQRISVGWLPVYGSDPVVKGLQELVSLSLCRLGGNGARTRRDVVFASRTKIGVALSTCTLWTERHGNAVMVMAKKINGGRSRLVDVDVKAHFNGIWSGENA